MREAATLGELASMNEVLAERGFFFRFPLKDETRRRITITGDGARRLHAAPVRSATHVVVITGGDRPAAHAAHTIDGPASNYASMSRGGTDALSTGC